MVDPGTPPRRATRLAARPLREAAHHRRGLRLVGRPDQLVRIGGQLIPVEQKPQAWRVHDSHVLQVAAECLLVSEVYGVRPPYGLLVLANGRQHRVPFTRELEQRLLQTLARMNALLETNHKPDRKSVV